MPRRRTPRRRNYNEPGHAHELTFSIYRGHPFLNSARTRIWLADAINAARVELEFDLWAYVVMPEHVHLIVFPRRPVYDIAIIRSAIKEPVGRAAIKYLERHAPEWIPRITRRRGQKIERLFWQSGGGFDRNITEPRTLASMIDYIHLNPVRRGLVQRACDWLWSSAAWFEAAGESPIPLDRIPPEWTVQGP